MKKIFAILAVSASLLSCKKDKDKSGEFKGPQATVHHGKAWSTVKLDKEGVPQQLSITIDDAALNSVPTENDHAGGGNHHSHEDNVRVPLHGKASEHTPFRFIELNWNPEGHSPDGIYDIPHFDFHFYMVPEAEVMNSVDPVKLNADPQQGYLPPMHIAGPPVPRMGKHWIDVTSPELNGQIFTQTFIYRTYDSKVTFYEPMITLDFLKTTNSLVRDIPQPAKFAKAGHYPTKMRITKTAAGSQVTLEGFVYRQAS